MIEATIFDLDGTLVKTERLKALSYARAAVELCPYVLREEDVIQAYKEVVGLPRRAVATALVERFGLYETARSRTDELGVTRPWQAFVQVRLRYYEEMISDPDVLRDNRWPGTIAVLHKVRKAGCKVALATMSRCQPAQHVLESVDLAGAFDFVATRDDVDRGKPDPQIYQLVARELAVEPVHCLVIEDSPSGVRAALGAGMQVVALGTPFTRERLHQADLLPPERIVDDPEVLPAVVEDILSRRDLT
jgi:HAD superfamily hydrolase (TIGR01509 family)